MKYLCSLKNAYQVIGLSSIEEFNRKISEFDSNSFNTLMLTKDITLLEDKPLIETIEKAYINIEITRCKAIKTPKSKETSVEGIYLTGKMLLVSGIIKETIIYKSLIPCNKMNTIKAKIPFNSYIVMDFDIDVNKDDFCVFPFIENISLNVFDKKKINNNISLFLFAHKAELDKKYLINDIIFRNDQDEEMLRIRFDLTNKVFVATATDVIEEFAFGDIFTLILYDDTGTNKKIEGNIPMDEDAKNLANIFNNKSFDYDDIINFDFLYRPNRVVITNYPNEEDEYNPIFRTQEAFKITPSGLVKYVLKNKIVLLDENDDEITSVNFSLLNNELDASFTGNKTPIQFSSRNYFIATLKDLSGGAKFSEILGGDEDAEFFQSEFPEEFKFNDIIEIFCEEPNRVKVMNFPLPNETYTFTEKTERFSITKNGLLKSLNPIIKNRIFFKSKIPLEIVAELLFNSFNKTLYVESHGVNCGFEEEFQSQNFFEIILKSSNNILKKQGSIKANEDGEKLKNKLNNTPFEYGDILTLKYKLDNQILIVNFPREGDDYEEFLNGQESFKITKNGLTWAF